MELARDVLVFRAEHRQRPDHRPPPPRLVDPAALWVGRGLSPPLLGTVPGPAPLRSVPRLWARPLHTAHPAVPAQALPALVQGHLLGLRGAAAPELQSLREAS